VQEKEYKPSGFTYALHRAELVGAFFNGVFLLALALSIFLQSMERFINIEFIENPLLMLIVGCVGLSLNLISASIVHGR
jgi:zinc transporter 1